MKRVFMKIVTSANAIGISAMLSMTPIFAAEGIVVDGTSYGWDDTKTYGDDTWSWTNSGNDLNLNGYNGGCIYALGDISVNLTGTNTVTTKESDISGIYATKDLTIKGEENASLTVTGDSKIGISTSEDLTIENTKIDASGKTTAITGANVTIKDSDVKATATGTDGIGISALGNEENKTAGKITIENSNVEASGSDSAMMANPYGEKDSTKDKYKTVESYGEIEIINSYIATEGAKVYVDKNPESDNFGFAYISDSEGKAVQKVVIKKGKAALNRKAVDTGFNTDISFYITAGLVAMAGANVVRSLKKKSMDFK